MVYSARTVNAVLIAEFEQPYTMQVTLNGQFLTEADKRQDIAIDENGRSFLTMNQARMYNVIDSSAYSRDALLTMGSN